MKDIHYNDRWDWLLPVYTKLCVRHGEHREELMKVQSAILLGDKEMVVELMGRLIIEIKKVRV